MRSAGTGSLLPNLLGDWAGRPIAGPVGASLGRAGHARQRRPRAHARRAAARRGPRRADLVCIALGTGVGGGVVIGGRLHLGLGHAGEIGHTTVDPDGPLCGCGNRGCLDRMASAESIAAAAGRADRRGGRRGGAGRRPQCAGRVRARRRVCGPRARGRRRAAVARARRGRRRRRDAGELLLDPLRAELRRRACVAPATRSPSSPPSWARTRAPSGAALWSAEVSRAA